MYETDVATMAVMSILAFTSIVGNSLVCAVVKRNRDMRYIDTEPTMYRVRLTGGGSVVER